MFNDKTQSLRSTFKRYAAVGNKGDHTIMESFNAVSYIHAIEIVKATLNQSYDWRVFEAN